MPILQTFHGWSNRSPKPPGYVFDGLAFDAPRATRVAGVVGSKRRAPSARSCAGTLGGGGGFSSSRPTWTSALRPSLATAETVLSDLARLGVSMPPSSFAGPGDAGEPQAPVGPAPRRPRSCRSSSPRTRLEPRRALCASRGNTVVASGSRLRRSDRARGGLRGLPRRRRAWGRDRGRRYGVKYALWSLRVASGPGEASRRGRLKGDRAFTATDGSDPNLEVCGRSATASRWTCRRNPPHHLGRDRAPGARARARRASRSDLGRARSASPPRRSREHPRGDCTPVAI